MSFAAGRRSSTMPASLREQALRLLLLPDADLKAAHTRAVDLSGTSGANQVLEEPAGIPGRPALPSLVPPAQVPRRSMATPQGRAALIHALAHIELNAIDLALDLCWRFGAMPDDFYRQWMRIAQEEALHFELLRDHLRSLGFAYGDFPAHNGLWEMALKTRHDLIARVALVPRLLEARGLDASPPIKAKLVATGDIRAGEILDIILRDEIGHVAVGNHWYKLLCAQRALDPVDTFRELASRYQAPRLHGPFNLDARRAAGFDETELQELGV